MGRAQAQATAQRTQAITNQESFQLVKCLIRVSVYHVCWMRGLFPDDSFTGHDLAQLDKLHVKMLEPNEDDDEATTLKNWVEQGVMDAVAKGFLKNMYFGIAQDAAATHLLEEYIYSFQYREDGVDFEMTAGRRGKKKEKYNTKGNKDRSRPGVDDVRYQVVRLMRMLVQLCQTLDQVPEERYLFIKLTYHNHTPEDYEPPFFHGVSEDGIGHFHKRPFSMGAGCMDTHHHMVSVRVKSVLDSCGDEADGLQDDEAMMELQASQQMVAGDEEMATDEAAAGGGGGGREDETAVLGMAACGADLSPSAAAAANADNAKLRTEEAMAMLTATEDPNSMMMMMMMMEDGMEDDDDPPQAPQARVHHHSHHHHHHQQQQPPVAPTDSQTDNTCLTDGDQQHPQQQQHHVEGAGSGGQQECGSGDGDSSGQLAYESVRRFCLARSAVSYVDLLTVFYNLSDEQLGKVVDGLQREGLIKLADGSNPRNETYVVLHPNSTANITPPPATAAPHPHGGPTTSEGIMAEAPGAGSGGSVAPHHHHHNNMNTSTHEHSHKQQQGQQGGAASAAGAAAVPQDHMLSSKMSGLCVAEGAAGAASGGYKARGMAAADASVYGAALRAGSLMTGQPGVAAAAPTAATPQVNPHTAGDEPSVQLRQDQQQSLWFDASQQSFQGPPPPHAAAAGGAAAATPAAGSNAAAAAAAAAAQAGRTNSSRLRKASYVNSPIYQNPSKRSKLRLQQQQEEEHEEQAEQGMAQQQPAVANADEAGDAGDGDDDAGVNKENFGPVAAAAGSRKLCVDNCAEQQQMEAAPGAAGSVPMQPPPRKKVVVRKPKKTAAATAAGTAAGVAAPSRGSGRLAAMRG